MKKLLIPCLLLAGISFLSAAYHFDKAVELNRSGGPQNQYILLNPYNTYLYVFPADFTMEFWLNVREWSVADQVVIAKNGVNGSGNGWTIQRAGSTSAIVVDFFGNYITSQGVTFVNQWHHLACVRSGNTLYLYVDGALNNSQTFATWSITYTSYPACVGESLANTGHHLHGKVDEIRFWNYARTATQIRMHRFNRVQETETGLICYLKLNESSSAIGEWSPENVAVTFFNYDSGVWQNATQLEETYSGDKACQFGSGNPQVQFANLWSGAATQFTAEAWIKASSLPASGKVILKHSSLVDISILNSQITATTYLSGGTSFPLTWSGVLPNQWYHVALSINTSGLCALYINGWLAASVTRSGPGLVTPGVSDLWSVGNSVAGGANFPGVIDQVRVWNWALSSTEVWANRHLEIVSGPLATYTFNETTNSVIFNRSGLVNCLASGGSKLDSDWPKNGYYFKGTLTESHVLPVNTISVWGDIIIPATKKLTVQPGTTLRFLGHYGILAEGSLQALGTAAAPIIFTVADTTGFHDLTPMSGAGSWNGLAIRTTTDSDSTLIEHCHLEYGKAAGVSLDPSGYDAASGGAVHVYNTTRVRISHSVITNNIALGGGGALLSRNSTVNMLGNSIIGNYSDGVGGALVFMFDSSPSRSPGTVLSNLIAENTASDQGGGIYLSRCTNTLGDPATDRFRNNTIANNHAGTRGGGIYYSEESSLSLRNSIIWGNTAPEGGQIYLGSMLDDPSFSYCDIQGLASGFGGGGSGAQYSGVLTSCMDADPMFAGSGDHPYSLKTGSGCINRGEPGSALSALDILGNPRVYASSGGINPQMDAILGCIDLGAYEDQAASGTVPYDFILEGSAAIGHNITVPHGSSITLSQGSALEFAPQTGIDIYGSMLASGTLEDQISLTAQNQALGWDGLAFLGENTAADTSYVAWSEISHGATSLGDLPYGGLVCVDGYARLNISNCFLSHGSADKGGALAVLNSPAEFYNLELHHNSAESGGGAVYLENADPLRAHLTIADNSSLAGSGAISASNSDYARIFGCNIWNNGATPLSGTMLAMYSNVQGGYGGSTNISEEPAFDPEITDHYVLSSTSPCLNKGIPNPGSYPNLPLTDVMGNPRIHSHTQSVYSRPDIGASEYQGLLDPTNFSATDGSNDYLGHVYLSWNYPSDYLPNDGFQIYRDGSLLVTLYPHITSYADYSAIPGQQHAYTLLAYAGGETSNPIADTGYIKPNGIITGKVQTPNNNPVSGVIVSLSPSSGYCLQFAPGSFFTVEVPDASLGASFTLETWVKTSSSNCTLLAKTDSSETDLKQLRVNAFGRLLYTDGISTLEQSTESPAVNDNAWHHVALAYNATAGRGYLYLDGICVADSDLGFSDTPGGTMYVQDASFTGFLDDIRLWSITRTAEEIGNNMNLVPSWDSDGLIGYWPMNEGVGAQVFDATNFAHVASTNAVWSSAEPGVVLGGVTDNWGEYVISQIPYGSYTTFTVTPSKPGHMFQPEQRRVTLSQSNISADNVDFTDNSMIPISGYVRFHGTICPVVGAKIFLNGTQALPVVTTNSEGYYVLEVEHGTDCLVSVDFNNHAFDRSWDLGSVTYPRTNIDFQDIFTTGLLVQVAGGSDSWPLGDFDVSLNSVDGLYTNEITGQDWYTGTILISSLPPLDYNVTVNPVGADPFNLAVDSQFQSLKTRHLDLRDADSSPDTLRYEWRAALQAEVIWPDGLELKYFNTDTEHLYGFYVIGQNVWTELQIGAFEDYSIPGYPERKTYLTDCDILVTDDVGAIGSTEASFSGAQSYTYRFAPYLPNILAGGDRPYQNMLEVTVHDAGLERFATSTDWVITQGARPTESTYATTSPEIPFLILHDPPGDASYASFKQSSSHSTALSMSYSSVREDGAQVSVHLGPDITTEVGFMFSVQTVFDFIFDLDFGYSCRKVQTTADEFSFTFTTTEEYKTTALNQLIGRESDLYIGGALNLIWGLTREVVWNDTTQAVILQDNVMVVPDGFDTVYMYTEAQILNNVIPNLIAIGDSTSAAMWQSYVDMNSANIAAAQPNGNHPSNVSFNAGAGYLYEETSSSSDSHTFLFQQEVSESFGMEIGAVVNGIGGSGGFTFEAAVTTGHSETGVYATETSISYELADDDETSYLNFQPDYFTLDIKRDPVYGTPVFDLLAGASSNRWEANTLPRDGVSFSANTYSASGLQEGETAAFLLNLGNTSQTGEYRRYFLTLKHETNPGGAVILINGLPVVDRMVFDVPPGQQVQAVMTVAQGPVAYEYEGLTLEFFAEGDRGHDGPDGHDFWVTRSFNVYWEPPYSRVEIAAPEEGWIVNQASNGHLGVMLLGYDLSKPGFNSLLLQYKRPSSADWLPALEIPRDSLLAHPRYIELAWDVSGLADGPWQIRAGTTDNIQNNYYSPALNGIKDTSPPALWGLPQPADGILQPGDLISLSFTESIDPDSVQPGCVALTVLSTGIPVDADVQVSGSGVAIVPAIANYWLENEILQVSVQGLKDMFGNPQSEPVAWEFFVNANPVYWAQPKISLIKALGEPLSVSAQLCNSGGQYSSFSITGLPPWLTAQPLSGSLLPLDSRDIVFNISSQLGFGVFRDTVYADIPALGREPLLFEISVLSNPPAWASAPLSNFDFSMTITGQIHMEGELSTDPNDVIGAFVYDPDTRGYLCRGAAALVEVPYAPGSFHFFLTVFSDLDEGGELYFRVWDASENKEHFGIQEQFSFSAGMVYGTPLNPVTVHVNPELIGSTSCRAGWNWLSVNLDNASSMAVNDLLDSLSPSANDIVKNQTDYAQYVPSLGWVGGLQSLSTAESFKLKLAQPGDLNFTGLLEDPASAPISYGSGWNWIGYLPHVSIGVGEALAGISNPSTGDIIKSQSAYAQYLAGYGWFGSLLFMDPGKGYMLKTAASGSFCYPDYEIPRGEQLDPYAQLLAELRSPEGWSVNPLDYEFTSNVTAAVYVEDVPLASPNSLLGAFYGSECRGVAAPVWVVDKYVYFLTQYSNAPNQTLAYKVWLADTGEVFTASETMPFVNNQVLGNPLSPLLFHIGEADLQIPQNLLLQIEEGILTLTWDESSGATSYLVFASDAPEGDYEDITSQGTFARADAPAAASLSAADCPDGCQTDPRSRISWHCLAPAGNHRFYRVIASAEVPGRRR